MRGGALNINLKEAMLMQTIAIPRIIIAGTNSGVGKTTIVTGLLAALTSRGFKTQSYKVGPDYIDPGYHKLASGQSAHNLDTWLVPEDKLAAIFARTATGKDIAIIEGVMGLYDGGRHGVSSTAAISKLLNAPVILVVDARSMGESAAAIVLGFKMYDPDVKIAGVIINRLGSDTHREMVVQAIEKLGVPVIGALRRNPDLAMPERHLGLTPVTENEALDVVAAMGHQMEAEISIEKLVAIANAAPALQLAAPVYAPAAAGRVRIGVAHDEVFSFYYPESLQVLAEAGAELIHFSPLHDDKLPAMDGMILGGGFPEMFVERLQENQTMRQDIFRACKNGMPVYAECGGLMYLSESITDFSGNTYQMAGVVPAVCSMQKKLETVGYVEVTALSDNVLCSCGDKLKGHEFHFSTMTPQKADDFPWAFQFTKVRNGVTYSGGFACDNVLASYLHMHFVGNARAAEHFVEQCRQYRNL